MIAAKVRCAEKSEGPEVWGAQGVRNTLCGKESEPICVLPPVWNVLWVHRAIVGKGMMCVGAGGELLRVWELQWVACSENYIGTGIMHYA